MDVIRRLLAEWYPDERSLGTRVTGMVAECVLAALVITATFVTTERPVRGRQTLPIYWNRLDEKARFLQEGSMDVMGLAAEFGLRNGISFPLHGAAGENGILSFITRERASSDLMLESSPILSWMSNYIFEAAIRIVRQSMREDDPQEPLTERETECLFWASEGKTSGEIACILGITERTVNYHLNQVTRKTGSMNRYQAIAKGVSSGILLPNLEQVVVTNFPSLLQ